MMQKIKNYSNYSVDENGNIYSNFRIYIDKNKNQGIKQRTIRLKPSLMKNGYQRVSLYDDHGNKKTRLIHRIVAETFLVNIDNKPCINHKDGNKTNNEIFNLEWCTHKENREHAIRTGLAKGMPGEEHPLHKILSKDVKNIIKMIINGIDNETIAKMYKLNSKYVSLIRHKKRWKQVIDKHFPNYVPINSNKDIVIKEHTKSKIPLIEQLKIISDLMSKSNKELSEQYNIDPSVFSRIRNKKAWKYAHKIYNLNAQRLSKG